MHKSQNTISFFLLFALTISVAFSSGCKMGAIPKMPQLPTWKKDNFKLSRSGKDSIAPPSRTFDPKPSHFATQNADRNESFEIASSEPNRPIRKPYNVDESDDAGNNFGFPKNADSLFGNKDQKTSEFSVPEANEFRQAMNSTTEKASEFVNRSQDSASQAFGQAKEFVSNSANRAGDFAKNGGDFVAKRSQEVLGQSGEFAHNATGQNPNEPAWKSDFDLPQPDMKKPKPLANQLIGNDFQASVKRATADTRNSISEFNQNAISQVNQGFQNTQQAASDFAKSTVQSTNQQLTKAAGQFEKSWQNSVDQAKAATQSIRNSTQQVTERPPANQPNIQGDFRPRSTQPSNSLASSGQEFQPKRMQNAGEVSSQTEFARANATTHPMQPKGIENAGSQFTATEAGTFQSNMNRSTPAGTTSPSIQTVRQPANSRYPSTNYSAYGNQGPDRISQVTPIEEPASSSMLRARTKPATQSPAARTASLPSELLQGNGNYAPGSVKQLSPIR